MPVLVTAIYAALLALLFLTLSLRVIRYRRAKLLSLGDEGDRHLLRLMRAQANCAEYVPIGLLLMLIGELQGLPYWLLHVLGLMLLAGRVLHGIGFSSRPQKMPLRVVGMALTLLQLAIAALCLLAYSLL